MKKILVPRNLEGREEAYKKVCHRKIQNYIKRGGQGDLILLEFPLQHLPDNLQLVNGHLFITHSPLCSLPRGLTVTGSISLVHTEIARDYILNLPGYGITFVETYHDFSKDEHWVNGIIVNYEEE